MQERGWQFTWMVDEGGLVVSDKAERVAHYSKMMHKEIGIIAHSCGVKEPRGLKRMHCRVVQNDSISVPLDEIFPDVKPEKAEEAA